MDYNDQYKKTLDAAMSDLDGLVPMLQKHQSAAMNMLSNIDKHIPKEGQKEFADALESQVNEMNKETGKAWESVEKLRKKFSS